MGKLLWRQIKPGFITQADCDQINRLAKEVEKLLNIRTDGQIQLSEQSGSYNLYLGQLPSVTLPNTSMAIYEVNGTTLPVALTLDFVGHALTGGGSGGTDHVTLAQIPGPGTSVVDSAYTISAGNSYVQVNGGSQTTLGVGDLQITPVASPSTGSALVDTGRKFYASGNIQLDGGAGPVSLATDVTIASTIPTVYYQTVASAGSAVVQEGILDLYAGSNMTLSFGDSGGATKVTFSAASSSGGLTMHAVAQGPTTISSTSFTPVLTIAGAAIFDLNSYNRKDASQSLLTKIQIGADVFGNGGSNIYVAQSGGQFQLIDGTGTLVLDTSGSGLDTTNRFVPPYQNITISFALNSSSGEAHAYLGGWYAE